MLLKATTFILILQIIDAFKANEKFIIKNKKTGFVLDSSKQKTGVSRWIQKQSQLWTLEPFGDTGRYIIHNVGNGKVLDACPKNKRILTWRKHKGKNQQWILQYDPSATQPDEMRIKVLRFPNHFLAIKKGYVKLVPAKQSDRSDIWLLQPQSV